MLTIDKIELGCKNEETFKSCFLCLQSYMKRNEWCGACHATTGILYAFTKILGIDSIPCIGEVYYKVYFDHS